MGRWTAHSAVEGHSDSAGPSTSLRLVPLPIAFGDREDQLASPLVWARSHCSTASTIGLT